MVIGDPIGDFIIRLKNASAVGKESTSIPYSNFKFAVADKLKDRGYIKSISKRGKKTRKYIDVELLYSKGGTPKIQGVKRLSKPGRRTYQSTSQIIPVKGGHGSILLSTPKGILTGDEARKEHIGGEALFTIW